MEKKLYHILTPVPPANLRLVNCLLLGNIAIPNCVLVGQVRAHGRGGSWLSCSWLAGFPFCYS